MKKSFWSIAVLLICAMLFTACGTGPPPTTKSTTSSAVDESNDAGETTGDVEETKDVHLRFMWWGGDARHEATMKVIEQYTAANPGVTIDAEYGGMDGYYQKLTTQISSGTEPDIIQIIPEWFLPLGRTGDVFYDLEKDGVVNTEAFDQDYLATMCTIEGQLQGLPTGGNGSIMALNNTFLEQFSIPTDTVWDWETLKTKGGEVHAQDPEAYLLGGYVDGDGSPIALLAKYHVLQQEGTNGWVNTDFTLGFTQEHLVNTFNYLLELQDNGTLQPVEETSLYKAPLENPAWISGKVGMMHAMPSTLSIFETDGVELDVAAVPVAKGATDTGVVSGPPQFLVVSNNSEHPEEAAKFIDYFFNSEEAVTALGTSRGPQPTSTGSKILLDAGLIKEIDSKAMQTVLDTASAKFNLLWLTADFTTPYNDACNAVLFGTSTPEQAAEKMIQEFEEACETLKNAQ